MNCKFHPEREAIVVCVECKTPLCKDCLVKIDGRNYCNDCVQKQTSDDSVLNTEKENLSQLPQDLAKVTGKLGGFISKKSSEYKNKTGKGIDNYKNKTGKGMVEGITNVKEVGNEMITKFSDSLKEGSTREIIKNTKIDTKNPLEEIKKAKELLELGAITQEEYDEIKKKYLKSM